LELKRFPSTSSPIPPLKKKAPLRNRETNHQLRRCILHLEHNLRDISARCSAERERRMSLEAFAGGKIFTLV
jgi:hypothetical protein